MLQELVELYPRLFTSCIPVRANKKVMHNFGSESLRNLIFGRNRCKTVVHNPSSPSNISIKVKLTGSKLARYIACIWEIRNA
jgi:hypothetical protein